MKSQSLTRSSRAPREPTLSVYFMVDAWVLSNYSMQVTFNNKKGDVNWNETVVYSDNAIRPVFMLTF